MATTPFPDPRAADLPRPSPPWREPRGTDAVVAQWLASGYVRPCLAADHTFDEMGGRFSPLPAALHAGLRSALTARGITQLYTHQALAFERAMEGKHLVVATPTASGKSLCFHLPVLDTLAKDEAARALYLFPTKALSRDQEASLGELIQAAGLSTGHMVYDGDTPGDARRVAKDRAGIVLTNPDMLHAGILPQHARWAKLFQGLRFVVLDELHTYRGVFGSHMAHVIARLCRVARFHGANPTFLCATATIGNPRAHAARLLGVGEESLALLDESGAPRGDRRFFLFNPPVVNRELGIRASYLKSTVMLASDLVKKRVPTLVFGPSRNAVEIMLKYLREACPEIDAERAIVGYRGGYLPEARRRTERGLRNGEVLCVVATNALELGIDIGDLTAVVCASYPGSMAALWQRFGRAGRRGDGSILVLVTSSAPVDQYFAKSPEQLLGAPIEEARIDPSNVEIVLQHLKCAAFELPFASGRAPYAGLDPGDTDEALHFLARHGVLHESKGRFHWAADVYPANHVSLRNVSWDNFVIVERGPDRTIGELDWRAAHTMLHEQAIYQQDGEQYQVEELDYDNHKAYVAKVLPDYFTEAMVNRSVSVIEVGAERPFRRGQFFRGEVAVVEKIVGYKKIKFFTHENAGYGDVHLPDMQMHTTSFWLTVPADVLADVGRARAIDALRGIGRAFETVAAISLMCDPRDIGQALGNQADEARRGAGLDPHQRLDPDFDPTLFWFDNCPGGIGLAERIFETAEELFRRTYALIGGCPCESGCPSCVGPGQPGEDDTNAHGLGTGRTGRKATTLDLLLTLGFAR